MITQHNFNSIKLHLWGQPQRFILVYLLPLALNIVVKDLLFVTCYDILEKRVISLPWKKTRRYGYVIFFTRRYEYVIFFTLLTKSMRKPNALLAHSLLNPIFFKQIMDQDILSQVLILEYFCADRVPTIFSKYLDQGLDSSLNDLSPGQHFWKPVSDLAVSNDTLAMNTTHFLFQ